MKKLFMLFGYCIFFTFSSCYANGVKFELSDGEITFTDDELTQLRKASTTIDNLFSDAEPTSNNEQKLPLRNMSKKHFELISNFLKDDQIDIEKSLAQLDIEQLVKFLVAADFLDMPQLLIVAEKNLAIRLTEPTTLRRFVTEPDFLSTLQLPIPLSFAIANMILQLPTTSIKKLIKNIVQIPIKKLSTTNDIVKSLCLSRDGILFSGGAQGTIKLWDSATGNYLHTLQHHGFGVNTLILNKENTLLFAGTSDMITIWDVKQTKLVKVIPVNGLITFALKNDNTLFASTHHRDLQAWSAEWNELPLKFPQLTKIMTLCFSDDVLFAGYNDGSIIAWNSNDGTQLYKLTHHSQPITALQIHEGILFSSSADRKIVLFDGAANKTISTLNINAPVLNFCFLKKNLLCALDESSTISIWDYVTGKNYFSLKNESKIISLITQPTNVVLAGSRDTSIYHYDFNPLIKLITTLNHNIDFSQSLLFLIPEQIDLNTMPQFIEPFHTLDTELQQMLVKIKKVVPISTFSKTYQYLKSFFHRS